MNAVRRKEIEREVYMANQPAKSCYRIIESMLNIEVEKEVNDS